MSMRILLADDSPFWREQLTTILEEGSDWTVFQATNGAEAVQKSVAIHPDAVVLDEFMPELDGLAAARELKRAAPALPVFIVTADKSLPLVSAASESGVPVFSKMEFLEVCKCLRRAQHRRAA
jgi:DNA-binding NarL/FixJ family response regulator